jgi:acetyl esterase/lipase
VNQKDFLIIVSLLIGTFSSWGYDIPGFPPDQITPYKQTTNSSGGAVTLNLHIFNPENHSSDDSRPVIVLFFGGGWTSGSPGQFHPHCEYLASRGMVAISAEYRVSGAHGTSPQECVKDGKSAIRWVRENAGSLGIDPNRIAAGGGSAGGHIAAAAATLDSFEEAGENLSVSSRPNALVLYNPVYDNGPGGYGHSRVQAYWEDFSPLHNIDETIPPAIVFLGTSDSLISVSTAKNFKGLMATEGVRSDLHLYQDQPHSFFNYDIPDDARGPYYGYQDTIFKTNEFLVSLGYLEDTFLIPEPVNNWLTIFGSSGFLNGSENTASPLTTSADGVAIAAAIPEIDLENGEFIRVTGSATFDAPLSGSGFRVGLFDGDVDVSDGASFGYRGIWAEAPGTSASQIREGNGQDPSHPFESINATTLGSIPGTSSQLGANVPFAFSLMIARNGDRYDITTSFDDGSDYHAAQNLLSIPLRQSNFDRVAFFMADDLDGSSAQFSNLTISSGRLPTGPIPEPTSAPSSRVITYVDAVAGTSGNTFATGSDSNILSWLVNPGSSSANESQWGLRPLGNDSTVFQVLHSLPDTIPELNTRISGLDKGTYEVWAFYWDQVDSDTQNWTLSAGLNSGDLSSYSSPDQPAVGGATTDRVVIAKDLMFSTEVLTIDGGGLRNLFGVSLGQVSVSDGGVINVFTDNLLGNGSRNRTWFDGVGYARVNKFESWIAGFDVGNETALGDDPDQDGNSNGLEGFYGTNPALAEEGMLTISQAQAPNQILLRHPQSTESLDDLSFRYQWSTDLVDFKGGGEVRDDGSTVTFDSQRDFPEEGTTTVTATVSGAATRAPVFLRIAVMQTSP